MKSIKKLFACLLSCTLLIGVANISPVKANTSPEEITYTVENISQGMEELDPYVKVENNSFVLRLPQHIHLSLELANMLTNYLNEVNKSILDNNLRINPENGRVYDPTSINYRSYGKNAVYFHWNYLEIYLDAGMVQNISTTGVGALWGIAGIFTPVLAAHPVITVGVGVILSLIANAVASSTIRDGIVMHLNFFEMKVTYLAKQ